MNKFCLRDLTFAEAPRGLRSKTWSTPFLSLIISTAVVLWSPFAAEWFILNKEIGHKSQRVNFLPLSLFSPSHLHFLQLQILYSVAKILGRGKNCNKWSSWKSKLFSWEISCDKKKPIPRECTPKTQLLRVKLSNNL